ncbi:MAG: Rpn family recombination-promoting nuclease/putative transposase [Prevotellaceae bacterium]|jgi:predicted transposase/invertase (TIGR01784 family)|nr:Rpn family recombination-promoting nuclease/putative transposase [Prevotellaceae bacterium]
MSLSKPEERALISFDYALKRLLRNKANYDVLEGFLSELLMRDIKVKNILESESNKQYREDKHNQVDILVEDANGELVIIELQFNIEMDYFQRMLYGTSKVIAEQMRQGDDYVGIKKVYSVNIVYFDLGQGADYVYHGKTHFKGLHRQDELQLSVSQRKVFGIQEAGDIYPEYYILKVNNFNDVAKDRLDEWIYFLKHNAVKDEFKAKGLDKAREVLARDRLSAEDRREYDYLEKIRSHNLSMIASAKDEGRFEVEDEYEPLLAEKDRVISEKDRLLAEQEQTITQERAEKDRLLAELTALKNDERKKRSTEN